MFSRFLFLRINITECFFTNKLVKDLLFQYFALRIQCKRIDKKYILIIDTSISKLLKLIIYSEFYKAMKKYDFDWITKIVAQSCTNFCLFWILTKLCFSIHFFSERSIFPVRLRNPPPPNLLSLS